MRVVINADDFGMSHEKNIAIDKMMREGVCTNASLAVNMPWTKEAVQMSRAGGYTQKISLHINLTVGEALSENIKRVSLYYNNGTFAYKPIIKKFRQIYPFHIKIIREEIEAQIETFLNFGLELRSLDSHNWVHLRIPVWLALKPLLQKYDIKIVRPMWKGYKRPEIASRRWSRYFSIMEPFLLRCPQCRVFGHSSNIEQFLLEEKSLTKIDFTEVFTHPDLVNQKIIDISSSYLRNPREEVTKNVAKMKKYLPITIEELLEEKKG